MYNPTEHDTHTNRAEFKPNRPVNNLMPTRVNAAKKKWEKNDVMQTLIGKLARVRQNWTRADRNTTPSSQRTSILVSDHDFALSSECRLNNCGWSFSFLP